MLFKSKLEHTDPDVRRQYVEEMAADDSQLLQVAQSDPHPEVRASAVTRIIDLQVVQQLSQKDAEERIRNLATARLQSLMSGSENPAPSLDTRLGFLDGAADQRLIRFVARSAREPELRKVAVNRLLAHQDQPLVLDTLCEIAGEDAVSEIRELAAKAIHDRDRLETLIENSRGKDKHIHRLARERLDAIDKDSQARESLDRCCLDAEQLAAGEFSLDGKAEQGRLVTLVKQWQEQEASLAGTQKTLASRFAAATAQIESRLKDIQMQHRQRADILQKLGTLRDSPDPSRLKELSAQWHELDEPTPAESRQFSDALSEITRHASQLERDEHRVVAKRAILKKMQQRLGEELRKATLARFEKRWAASPDPDDTTLKDELQSEFSALHEKARHKLGQQEKELQEHVKSANETLEEFEAAAEAGKIKKADSAHSRIINLLGRLEIPDGLKRELTRRLRLGEAKVAELRRWRHWSTERKREELCEQAVALVDSKMKVTDVASNVRKIREAWKSLDHSDGPASKKMWQRFDKACETAYAPCQAHFEQQKAKRAENMSRRVELCEKLEQLHGQTDWENPDWRQLSDGMRELQSDWRKAGAVDRRERNKIQKRFDQAYAALNEPLVEIRKAEVTRREELISRVEQAAGAEDNRKAVDIAKEAQRQWKPLVQSGRRLEQELWNRFRAACDAIFEKRKEHFAAADNERAQNLGEKMSVCGQLDEMAKQLADSLQSDALDHDLVRSSKGKIRELQNGWRRIGQVPRDKIDKVEKQFRSACEKVAKLCAQTEKKIAEQAHQRLREAATLCDQLELDVSNASGIEDVAIEQLEKTLQDLTDADSIQRRLKRLQKAHSGDATAKAEIEQAIVANLGTKSTICMELEIAANIDSPPEFREERMQYRVQQLSKAMSGQHKQAGPDQLIQQWYLTGPVPAEQQDTMEQRFRRASEALNET